MGGRKGARFCCHSGSIIIPDRARGSEIENYSVEDREGGCGWGGGRIGGKDFGRGENFE